MDIKIKLLSNKRFVFQNKGNNVVITAEHGATPITVGFPDEYENYSKRVDFLTANSEGWTESLYTPEFKEYAEDYNKSVFTFTLPNDVTLTGELRMQFVAYMPDDSLTCVPFEIVPLQIEDGITKFKKSGAKNPDLIILSHSQSTEALFTAQQAMNISRSSDEQSENAVSTSNKAKELAQDAVDTSQSAKDIAQSSEDKSDIAVATSNSANDKSNQAVNTAEAANLISSEAKSTANRALNNSEHAINRANEAVDTSLTAEQNSSRALQKSTAAMQFSSDANAKSEQAVETSNLAEQIAQEANAKSDTAVAESTNAAAIAVDAYDRSTTAMTQSNTAIDNSLTAISTANTAKTISQSAESIAGEAEQKSAEAVEKSIEAVSTANIAKADASLAVSTSEDAIEAVNQANAKSDSAVDIADTASINAEESLTKSNIALADSQMAVDTANEANEKSTQAVVASNAANTKSDQAVATANTAKATAETAIATYEQAISKADNATLKAENAVTLSTNASSMATAAETTATSASLKATNAETKADNAVATANDASTNATIAQTTANTALTQANNTELKATSALDIANNAATIAVNAEATANSVRAVADEANAKSSAAVEISNEALFKADAAKTTADTLAGSIAESDTKAANAVTTSNSAKSIAESAMQTTQTKAPLSHVGTGGISQHPLGDGGSAGFSTNDYTTAEKNKLAGIATGAQVNTITGVKGSSEENYRVGNITISKDNVGLGNVDNTSDTAKPISTATQTALNNKVDKVSGKQLSTEDYSSSEKTKLAGIQAGAQVNSVTSVAGKTGAVTLSKGDVGLASVDNTSDASKPISSATQTALNNKVDKVSGKQLSTEDYSSSEKTKLAGIQAGAQVNSVTGVKGNSESTYRTGTVNLTAANIGAEPAFSKNGAFNKSFGTGSGTVCEGNDSRLSNSRPASDVYSWAKASTKPSYTASDVGLGNVANVLQYSANNLPPFTKSLLATSTRYPSSGMLQPGNYLVCTRSPSNTPPSIYLYLDGSVKLSVGYAHCWIVSVNSTSVYKKSVTTTETDGKSTWNVTYYYYVPDLAYVNGGGSISGYGSTTTSYTPSALYFSSSSTFYVYKL